jgi:hypothetical protein
LAKLERTISRTSVFTGLPEWSLTLEGELYEGKIVDPWNMKGVCSEFLVQNGDDIAIGDVPYLALTFWRII